MPITSSYMHILVLCFVTISCYEQDVKVSTANSKEKLDSLKTVSIINKKATVKSLFHLEDLAWEADSETSSNYIRFLEDTVRYYFPMQCYYEFPAIYKDSSVTIYWDKIEDCVYETWLFENWSKNDEQPKIGDAFASFNLIETDVIEVIYFYSEWVKNYNTHVLNFKGGRFKNFVFPKRLRFKYYDF